MVEKQHINEALDHEIPVLLEAMRRENEGLNQADTKLFTWAIYFAKASPETAALELHMVHFIQMEWLIAQFKARVSAAREELIEVESRFTTAFGINKVTPFELAQKALHVVNFFNSMIELSKDAAELDKSPGPFYDALTTILSNELIQMKYGLIKMYYGDEQAPIFGGKSIEERDSELTEHLLLIHAKLQYEEINNNPASPANSYTSITNLLQSNKEISEEDRQAILQTLQEDFLEEEGIMNGGDRAFLPDSYHGSDLLSPSISPMNSPRTREIERNCQALFQELSEVLYKIPMEEEERNILSHQLLQAEFDEGGLKTLEAIQLRISLYYSTLTP